MNKVAVVTGATSGIGRALVEILLQNNIHVVALARQSQRADFVKSELKSLTTSVNLDFVIGDLKNNELAHQAGKDLRDIIQQKYEGKLDILFNVAGLVSSGYHENIDKNELTFAVNHLGPMILTYYLTPLLQKAKNPRVLVVSSLSHYRANINWKNIQSKKCYNILKAYKRSKLYNVFFVKAYANMFKDIYTFAIDPGLVKTEIGLKNTSKLAALIWKLRVSKGTDASIPSKHMLDIATNDQIFSMSGLYFKNGKEKKSNPITYDQDYTLKLLSYSESLIQLSFKDLIIKT